MIDMFDLLCVFLVITIILALVMVLYFLSRFIRYGLGLSKHMTGVRLSKGCDTGYWTGNDNVYVGFGLGQTLRNYIGKEDIVMSLILSHETIHSVLQKIGLRNENTQFDFARFDGKDLADIIGDWDFGETQSRIRHENYVSEVLCRASRGLGL